MKTRTAFGRAWPLAALAVLCLTACSTVEGWLTTEDEAPLPGERISVLQLQKDIEAPSEVLDAQGFVAPEAWRNDYWPQAGGFPNHSVQHLALNTGALQLAWSASIGKGGSDSRPLTVQPVVAGGRIYTMDVRLTVSAFDAKDGGSIWRTDLDGEDDDVFLGGGLAFSENVLYATSGFSELIAMNAADGKVLWAAKLPSPSRSAPSILDGRVYVTTIDNRLVAISTDGQKLWEYQGIAETAGLLGAASPAVNQNIVVAAFSSGELFALRVQNGSVAWSDNLAPVLRVGGLSGLSDIRALPVIDNGLVLALSYGGRMVAIDERTGNRAWQRDVGGKETPWVAGNHVFVLSSNNQLIAMGRDNGSIRWIKQLAKTEDPDSTKSDPVLWTAPVYAGGRLILANSLGELTEFAPDTGDVVRVSKIGEDVIIPPVIAQETLYLLARDGTLLAYR